MRPGAIDVSECAAAAWETLGGASPDRVEILKQDRGTLVCRLHVGGEDGTVIAKRSPRATATVERIVYEQCLGDRGLAVLRYYGAVEEAERCWLFVEEATGVRFHADKPLHRVAVSRWLATLHGSLCGWTPPSGLPARGPDYYRRMLESIRETADLQMLAAQCDRLSACWPELEAACSGAAETLVHGDLVAHNACLREGPSGLELLPFDFEKAGWGVAAEDLSIADLEVYAAMLGTRPDAALARLAGAGRVFRCLVFLDWVRPTFATDRDAALERIRLCASWIEQLMEDAPWRP